MVDIARKAGVSRGTVASVLFGTGGNTRFSPATADRVNRIAEESGYRRNRAARALATGRTHTIALLMPDQCVPYYVNVIHRVREHMEAYGFHTISAQKEDTNWREWPVDGAIAFDAAGWTTNKLMPHRPAVPCVHMGSVIDRRTDADFATFDLYEPTREAVRHLIGPGRHRVAHMLPPRMIHRGSPRYKAYGDAVKEAGVALELIVIEDHQLVVATGLREKARKRIRDYVGAHGCPEAIFCNCDEIAIGAHRGLNDLGLRIPQDVALAGCDGIEDGEYLTPSLSTIVHPIEAMCEAACRFLTQRLEDPSIPQQKMVLEARFVAKESSGSIAGDRR